MQAANNQQILDSLMSCLNSFNAGNKYDYVFNAANILIGDETDNITDDVLKAMNERYKVKSK
jgi:outer membrane protein